MKSARTNTCVLRQPVFHAAARRHQKHPFVLSGERPQAGQQLGQRRRTRDDVALGAGAQLEERPEASLAPRRVKQHFVREGVRLALDIFLRAARSQERVAILVQVTDLAGEVLVKIFADYEARGEAVADTGLGGRARSEDVPS